MSFKEMDQDAIRELLEKTDESGSKVFQDLLTPLAVKEETFFRSSSCPRCGGATHEAFVDPKRPFVPGSALPHRLLRCSECSTEYDPYSRLVTRAISS